MPLPQARSAAVPHGRQLHHLPHLHRPSKAPHKFLHPQGAPGPPGECVRPLSCHHALPHRRTLLTCLAPRPNLRSLKDRIRCEPFVTPADSLALTGLTKRESDAADSLVMPHLFFFFFKLINYFIYFYFLTVLGLRFCARAFSSCAKRGPLFITVRRPLTIAASVVAEHRLQTRRLSSCGSRA